MENIEDKIKKIEKKCLSGNLSPVEAVDQIDLAMGGITSVQYQEGLKFKLDNHNKRVGLEVYGFPKRELKMLHALAVCCYKKAQSNGFTFPGEVHIDKGCSTKHYKPGIDAPYQWATSLSPAYGGAR